jgi:hypothetical protein
LVNVLRRVPNTVQSKEISMTKKAAGSNGNGRSKAQTNGNGRANKPTQARAKAQPSSDKFITNADLKTELLAWREHIIANATLTRRELLHEMFPDRRRNINDECGYPDRLDIQHFRDMKRRNPVAARVVECLPLECWQTCPSIFEAEDAEVTTPFEQRWEAVCKNLREGSWFKGSEHTNPVWEYLKRADILSGIGSYGVIFLGLDDDLDVREPVAAYTEGADGSYGTWKESPTEVNLISIRIYPEHFAQILAVDSDTKSPRYGMPTKYLLTYNGDEGLLHSGVGTAQITQEVHWTRCIHVADNRESSDVYGVPRQEPVYDNLYDIKKLASGSAEMYWKGAFPGLSIETHPQLGGDVEVDLDSSTGLRSQLENYGNGLQRWLTLLGMSAKSLAPQVVDPTPQILIQIDLICIKLAIPKRIFMGSERGELASTQDDSTWNDRKSERQNGHMTHNIIVPFVDRLIAVGVLPVPAYVATEESVDEDGTNPEQDDEATLEATQVGTTKRKPPTLNVADPVKSAGYYTKDDLARTVSRSQEDGTGQGETVTAMGYCIEWPDLNALTDLEQADIMLKRTQAMGVYIQQGVEALIAPEDYLQREGYYEQNEAASILKNTIEHLGAGHPDTEEEITGGHVPAPPMPEEPQIPIKVKEGEKLVMPDSVTGGKGKGKGTSKGAK